jgi:hypothetical protein
MSARCVHHRFTTAFWQADVNNHRHFASLVLMLRIRVCRSTVDEHRDSGRFRQPILLFTSQ